MKTETLFSRRSDEWETPDDVFDQLDAEFHFDFDACATAENAKLLTYFDKDQDGLKFSWGGGEYGAILRTATCLPGCGRPSWNPESLAPS